MGERPSFLERFLQLLGLGHDGESAPAPSATSNGDGQPGGCEDVAELPCEEAARRVYEYLDGELDEEDAETVRCHVEKCERCYPMFNWEQMFLDALKERGDRPEAADDLRRTVVERLERETG